MTNNTAIGREWTVVPTTKTKTQEKEMEKSVSLMNEFMREWQWEPETVDLMDIAKVARDRRKGVYKEYELVKSPVDDVVVLAESVVADKNMNADWLDEWVDLGGNESKKSDAVKKSYSEAARVG
ncbi:hypothetical protein DL96DRAFT_1717736 [Flagelloscypha sp. PMI_526]|nr:hypothetical protein DL96DRAFT_1717736 [Flagelloscypha sp. PMI_526]